jgi:hypothetical protein
VRGERRLRHGPCSSRAGRYRNSIPGVPGPADERQLERREAPPESGLRNRLADEPIVVRRVKCTVEHGRDTHCVAHVVTGDGTAVDLAIAGVCNPRTGKLRWHTTGAE